MDRIFTMVRITLLVTSITSITTSLDMIEKKEQNKEITRKLENLTKNIETQNEVIKNIMSKYEK